MLYRDTPNTLANVWDAWWSGSGERGLNGPSGELWHGSMEGWWGREMGGFSRGRWFRSMGRCKGRWGPSAEILRKRCEGEAADSS